LQINPEQLDCNSHLFSPICLLYVIYMFIQAVASI